jgi:sulfite exporter TauE/SafE
MIALLGSVMAAGALGSLHCAAMCGPLQALYLTPSFGAAPTAPSSAAPIAPSSAAPTAPSERQRRESRGPGDSPHDVLGPSTRRADAARSGQSGTNGSDPRTPAGGRALGRFRGALAHAGGRLVSYTMLGALAGGVGAAVDLAGRAAAVQRAAMIVAGIAVILWGALALAAALGVGVPRLRPRVWNRALVQIRRRRPGTRAVLLGMLSAALPCGWLWAFVMLAAGTGSPLGGAAVMIAFWLGTVPMMLGVGAATAALAKRIGPRLPLVTALTLIAVGILSLAARVPMLHAGVAPIAAGTDVVPSTPACHAPATHEPSAAPP